MAKKSLFPKKKRGGGKVQLTSLMDALTIILIFLLTNYSDTPQEADVPPQVSLPEIVQTSQEDAQVIDIQVAIAKNALLLGPTKEGRQIDFNDFEAEKDQVLQAYKTFLQEKKVMIDEANKMRVPSASNETASDRSKIKITFYSDRETRYSVIDPLVFAASEVGINTFDFAVKTVEEE